MIGAWNHNPSNPFKTMSETLLTCPQCGIPNFTKRGLTAHVCKAVKTVKIVKADPETPALMKEFETARRHVQAIREHGRRAAHESILLGQELNRLKLQLGTKRGGDHKSAESKSQSATLIPWRELVAQETGLSYDTCDRCMTLASAARKHIPVLTAGDVLKSPFHKLPAVRQAEVVKALEKAADGRSMAQMMFDFGAWKEKKKNTPPPGGKSAKNDFKGGASTRYAENEGNDEAEMFTAMRDLAKEHHIPDIIAMRDGNAWQCLDEDDATHLTNELTKWLELLKQHASERQTAALKAKSGAAKKLKSEN